VVQLTLIWEMDPRARRFTYVSASAERMLGYPLVRWTQPDFWPGLVHPDDRGRVCAARESAAETLGDACVEFRAVSADGRTVWLRDRIGAIGGADGRARLLHGVMTDITSEKVSERQVTAARDAARRTTARLRALAAAAPAIVEAASIDALHDALAEAAHALIRPDAFGIAVPAADGTVRWRTGTAGAEPVERTLPLAGSAFEPALRDAASILFSERSDIADRSPLDGRYGAGLIVPVRHRDERLGAICAFAARDAAYDEHDHAAIEALAALAANALAALEEARDSRAVRRALRSSEAFNRLLLQVTAAANEAHGFGEAVAACLDALGRHAGWAVGHVFEQTETGELVSTGAWERDTQPAYRAIIAPSAMLRYPPGLGIVGRAVRSHQPVWVEDLAAAPGLLAPAGPHEVRSAFALPVLVEDEVVAVLEFTAPIPMAADAALLEIAPQIGRQLCHVLGRRRADDRIRFHARMLDVVGEAVIASDVLHRILYWNRAAESLFGWSAAEVMGRLDSDVLPARATPEQTADITARLAAGQSWSGEFMVPRKDGLEMPVRVTGSTIYDAAGAPIAYVSVSADLRRSRELEQRLRQAQRLEAVGRLAGGVAHDFNNLLTSIEAAAHLLLEDLDEANPLRSEAEEIGRAAERAARLTAQLLAFSRRQVMQPRTLASGHLLSSMEGVLKRLAGTAVEVRLELDPDAGHVRVDPAQLEQAIVNLVANARDAMAGGGRITVRARGVRLDAVEAAGLSTELAAGAYVALEVEDTGAGLEADQLDKIFDPFYTTKDRASGVGLGLSTAHGIVRQSDGHIAVASEPGRGTRFTIYLPRVAAGSSHDGEAAGSSFVTHGSETLLLVDDEPSIRRLARKVLDRQGYTVLEAGDGVEAIEVLERHDGPVDLVISDVVMPRMGGGELASRLASARPELPVLLISGYAEDPNVRQSIADSGSAFLEKPFTPNALARKVRSIIDGKAAAAG